MNFSKILFLPVLLWCCRQLLPGAGTAGWGERGGSPSLAESLTSSFCVLLCLALIQCLLLRTWLKPLCHLTVSSCLVMWISIFFISYFLRAIGVLWVETHATGESPVLYWSSKSLSDLAYFCFLMQFISVLLILFFFETAHLCMFQVNIWNPVSKTFIYYLLK